MRRSRKLVLGATSLALLMILGACGSGEDADTGGSEEVREDVTVGVSAAFAENQIVAEMYAQVLENAGYNVDRQLDLGSREISYPALKNGEIDITPEYVGTLLLYLDPDAAASGDAQNNADLLEPLLEEDGITLLEPSAANDTNGFVVTQETADEFGLSSVGDLADVAGDLVLGGPPECPDRPFCIPGLEETYGVTFGDFKPLDVGGPLTVAALEAGKIDVAVLFTTSSVIGANGWVVLEDDQSLQTADNITPVVRNDLLNDEITELLNAVSAELTSELMIELNGRVELDKEDPATVATDFLTEVGLL